ncbi:hypothetical protein [Enterococcus avium]|uniref:hypothetical protein n=1 Tax=Enterococcus avium TaxID=33945 RepID=UPI0032E45A62
MKATLVSFIDSSNIGDRLIAETLSEQLLTGIEIKKYSYKLIEESQVKINKNLVDGLNLMISITNIFVSFH